MQVSWPAVSAAVFVALAIAMLAVSTIEDSPERVGPALVFAVCGVTMALLALRDR